MKTVLIDGSSLAWMRESLGIGKFDWKGLLAVLTEEIGSPAGLYRRPLFVVSRKANLTKVLRTKGFQVTETFEEGQDDRIIIEEIKKLDPTTAHSELVLVSADQDFVEAVREAASKGIKVYWAATTNPKGDGSSMVSQNLIEFIEATDGIEFVELSQFKDRLMHEPWSDRERTPKRRDQENGTSTNEVAEPMKVVKITLSTSVPHSQVENILRDIATVIASHPTITYTIEG